MMQKNAQGIHQSSLLTSLGVVHGYSSRMLGDMRNAESRKKFLGLLGFENTVLSEQVHGNVVKIVTGDTTGLISGADGLVYKKLASQGDALRSRFSVSVLAGDCTPLLAIDPKANIIGAAHAGWRGTVAGIAKELIAQMVVTGADIKNIFVSIGPHIGMCCYDVSEDRSLAFRKEFGDNEKVTAKVQGKWHVDIGYANYLTFQDSGIKKEHIDAPPTCTHCQKEEFYSYRRDTKATYGEQMGVIGFI